ncbi:MAG: amidohydrolase family protein [Gammaproteobacteria bacterium]|nr:amidohydrolase family protein [Gammaproteobacteria bacterium]
MTSHDHTTVIRNLDWAVIFDNVKESHVYARGIDVAFAGGVITFVGKHYVGPADEAIDGSQRLLLPGLINVHSHPSSEPLRKGLTDETRSPGFHHSSLYEFLTVFDNDAEGRVASLQVALAELLMSGCTTVADLSAPYDEWLDTLGASGIRAVAAPGFRDARWFTQNGHSLDYAWDVPAGERAMARAFQLIDLANQHPSGRLSGMVYPAQVDTCSTGRLRDAYDHACARDLPWQTHVAQSVTEFHEMYRRHGKTPIQLLSDAGVLGDRSILGHAIFLDHHPWLHWTSRDDLARIADAGASVAHCPTVFARRGITLRTFGGYLRAGINMGIGTDTYPHHFLEEIRSAGYYARIIAETVDDLDTRDLFDAATLGGARALRRDDIGRVATGAQADLVLVDTHHPSMMPVREPLRSLVYVAAERAIRVVFVDGERVVEDGHCLTIDLAKASAALQAAQARAIGRTEQLDWAGRSAGEMAPMVYGRR